MNTFEDLPVWRAGRELVRAVYAATRQADFRRDAGLCDQIRRAAVSVPSNIAEGHERGSTADLIQFLFYAKGSAGEVRSQLYHAEDLGYLDPVPAERLCNRARDISRQISAWIQSMQTPGFRVGPRRHREPDRTFDRFLEQAGMERMSNGQICRKGEQKTEDGTRQETDDPNNE